ncbi:heme-degrading domain-containing protein [Escherichia coli]|nr:heme-degrading domain-containing protein [Escherichia coli]
MDYDRALLEEILKQETELQFPSFSNTAALALGTILTQEAIKNDYPVVIDISRCDQQIYYFANTGSSPDNEEWIKRKKKVTNRFRHSSLLMRLKLTESFNQNAVSLDSSYALSGGCFPVNVKDIGQIGTVCVSGLPDNEDHNLVVSAIRLFLNSHKQQL